MFVGGNSVPSRELHSVLAEELAVGLVGVGLLASSWLLEVGIEDLKRIDILGSELDSIDFLREDTGSLVHTSNVS